MTHLNYTCTKYAYSIYFRLMMTIPRRCRSFLLFMFHVCLCYAVVSVPYSLVITCWERADRLAPLCVVFPFVFVTTHIVSLVWCGTWLYRFLIFASFSTLIAPSVICKVKSFEECKSFALTSSNGLGNNDH